MKRSGIMRRTALARSGRVNPVNRERKDARYARDFGDEADLVRSMPCLVTGTTPSEPAHGKSRGAGGGRFDIFPLSPAMHRQQHSVGILSFAACHSLDWRVEADRIALGHPEPLGIRGLASRWIVYADPMLAHLADRGAEALRRHGMPVTGERLDDYEREALLGWVRRYMERADEKVHAARSRIDARREAKGMLPTTSISADRESLVISVAVQLELAPWDTKPQLSDEDLAPARALCELAGWPS